MHSSQPIYSIEQPPQKRSKRFYLLVALCVVLLLGIVFLVWFLLIRADQPASQTNSESIPTVESPKSVDGKYLFSGTVVLARAVENDAKTATGYDYSQPFSQFNTFNPKQYHGWMIDWECPTTDEVSIPYAQQIANTIFNCRPEWLPEVKKYFTFANLANNHSSDLGAERFLETREHLEQAGIQVVGNYDPSKTDDICDVLSLSVDVKMPDETTEKGQLPVAFCAWHYFERDPRPGEIETMQAYAEIMPVFGLMHVGVEYQANPDVRQQAVAKQIIDDGAEFVIGNSPHWVQGSEVYKNKPIFYSTGNFIFDQLEEETNRGVSIAVTLQVDYDQNVAAWLALGEDCKSRGDNCLSKAKEQNLQKITPKLIYQPVASVGGAHEITQKAPPDVQAAVEKRLNWAETKKELGQ